VTPGLVRTWVRAGLLHPDRGRRAELRFSVQDLLLLRTARGLAGRVPARRLVRSLQRLRERLPQDRPLTGIQIRTLGEDVVVREGRGLWSADSGQGVLDFDDPPGAARVTPLIAERAPALPALEEHPDWADDAAPFEGGDDDPAAQAFRDGLAHEAAGRLAEATAAYERALQADPDFADAHGNLAGLHERAGRTADAIRHLKAYRTLLRTL
jgi:tetratricopeptide (TPR) repeat protein